MADKNLLSYYETSNNESVRYETDLGEATATPYWSDALKITSQCTNFSFKGQTIYGGTEDCVDINNRCNTIRVIADYVPQGKYVATIKGGSKNVTLEGVIHGKGKEVDVDIGNWSDQSNEKTIGTNLKLEKADGSPIIVRVLNGTKPTLERGQYKFAFPNPDAWYHGIVVFLFLTFCKLIK